MLVEEAVTAYLELARWERLAEAKDKEKLASLVKAAAGGDKAAASDAAGELFNMYRSQLVSIARVRSGLDSAAAEDAVQDIMLKTLLKPSYMKRFLAKPTELIRGLTRVVINQGHDIRSKRHDYELHDVTDVPAHSGPSGALSPGERRRVRAAVLSTLRSLKPKPRAFIQALLFDKSGNLKPAKKGTMGPIALKYSGSKDKRTANNWGAQEKRRFLQKLCGNRDLCNILRGRRAGVGVKYICKGVKGSCAEGLEHLAGLHDLVEGSESWLTEEAAMDIVLSWLRGVAKE